MPSSYLFKTRIASSCDSACPACYSPHTVLSLKWFWSIKHFLLLYQEKGTWRAGLARALVPRKSGRTVPIALRKGLIKIMTRQEY